MSRTPDHAALADALRRSTLDGPGITPTPLRHEAAARAAGGDVMASPYDALARQIGVDAVGTTDRQVRDVVEAAGSEKAAFEIVAAAALGAGLLRWRAGLKALQETQEEAQEEARDAAT